ncbi:hypothetical protein ACFU8W_52315 [Streptomyces sp. NPDC057565]|uniref:hypothetical protein n=1 Tax=Streptomyces sp. NPDC057565 TaxID=3346169 RepID=UPI0036C42F6A
MARTAAVLATLKRRCQELAEQHPGLRTIKFTPHDFRRIFVTSWSTAACRSTSAQPCSAT